MKTRVLFILVVSSLTLISCRGNKPKPKKEKWSDAHSVDFNQEVNEREQLQIKLFLAHYTSLKMTQTESGLRYMIYQSSGKGPLAQSGQQATIRIRVERLNGTICYETPANETELVVIDKSEKESGIHEALKLMRVGDKAKLILPSYLGHGLLGDRVTIPPQAVLYFDVALIDLK